MTPEQQAAYIMAQAAALIAECLGMQAENMQRSHRGESMAYTYESFTEAIDRYGCSHNNVLLFFRG